MERAQRFEDLIAWQKARVLTAAIYSETNQGSFSRDFGLKDQVRRAAVSVMANVAEGFERGGAAEFCRFLLMAKGSSGELRSHLYVALDAGYIEPARFEELQKQATEVSRIVSGLWTSMEKYKP